MSRSRALAAPLVTLVVATALLLVAVSALARPSGATTSAHRHTRDAIVISNFMYRPMDLSVVPGTLVRVTNRDTVVHTLTAVGGQFNTGRIGHDQTRTFRAPRMKGVYHYYCSIHQFMVGTLRVR